VSAMRACVNTYEAIMEAVIGGANAEAPVSAIWRVAAPNPLPP